MPCMPLHPSPPPPTFPSPQRKRMDNRRHVLLATFPAQGHINPALQFAKKILTTGAHVTFFTSVYARRRMPKTAPAPPCLHFVAFSDGYDDGLKPGEDGKDYMAQMKIRGAKALRETLDNTAHGLPVTFLVYSHLFGWAAEVAREFHVRSALLWIEPATVLCIYYHYFNGYAEEIDAGSDEIQLPGLPLLSQKDLPSFLLPSTPERFRLLMKEKLAILNAEEKPKVLVNTFDSLEPEALNAIDKYELIAIGPLIPSAFLDGEDATDRSFGGDLFKKSKDDYLEWLDMKPESSVIYVSFGSLLRLAKTQMEELAKGLLDSGRPFLWVIRVFEDEEEGEAQDLSCIEEVKRAGKIVSWCKQLEVLTHPSVGCFVSHCGWNSAVESLCMGVPVVGFPQWFDQGTNAKLIEDVWGTGVRVRVNDQGGGVDGGEIRRCIEMVMDGGEKCEQVRENARKWKRLAMEAMEDEGGGSSSKNLMDFLGQV